LAFNACPMLDRHHPHQLSQLQQTSVPTCHQPPPSHPPPALLCSRAPRRRSGAARRAAAAPWPHVGKGTLPRGLSRASRSCPCPCPCRAPPCRRPCQESTYAGGRRGGSSQRQGLLADGAHAAPAAGSSALQRWESVAPAQQGRPPWVAKGRVERHGHEHAAAPAAPAPAAPAPALLQARHVGALLGHLQCSRGSAGRFQPTASAAALGWARWRASSQTRAAVE
jgi:hypothetical protein